MAFKTGATSVGEAAITFRMLALPVWYLQGLLEIARLGLHLLE